MRYLITWIGLILVICIVFGVFSWTDNNLDYLFTLLKNEETNCPYWLSVIISIVFNAIIICFNLIVSVLRFIGVI